jgi:hypothetical protein
MNFKRYIINIVKCIIKWERDFMVLNIVSRIGLFEYSSVYKILAFLLLVSRFLFPATDVTENTQNREITPYACHCARWARFKAICKYCD